MSRVLYFDCFSGISGDMVIGAFLDAGLPFAELQAALESWATPPNAPDGTLELLASESSLAWLSSPIVTLTNLAFFAANACFNCAMVVVAKL